MTDTKRATTFLVVAAVAGLLLSQLSPDSYQEDAGYHFLAARWAWEHPVNLIGVWNRPLFTLLYSVPAQFGYPAAKLFTLAVSLTTAYQTFRLAQDLRVERAWFAVGLIFLQPSFFLISADTMTEPLFGLLFVVAVRLHLAGRIAMGMVVASFLVTVRPEGFFLGVLWGVWVLADRQGAGVVPTRFTVRLISTLLLATGAVAWWLGALALTGDPLFILHNWPTNWGLDATYGVGPMWTYLARLPEIAGPLLLVPFVVGLRLSLRRHRYGVLTSSVVVLLVVHTVLRVVGWFGSAGFARYFVCVSPAIAILTLVGWNDLWSRVRLRSRARRVAGVAVLGISAIVCVGYADLAGFYGRDARAIAEVHEWFLAHPRPVTRLIWSQTYMDVLFDRSPTERPALNVGRTANMAILRESPPGTLVFWDDDVGPAWFHLAAADIEAAGYTRLITRSYALDGWLRAGRWLLPWSVRPQAMHLFYKDAVGTTTTF